MHSALFEHFPRFIPEKLSLNPNVIVPLTLFNVINFHKTILQSKVFIQLLKVAG